MDWYRVDDAFVKVSGKRFDLESNPGVENKRILKLQMDSNITSQIGPKDVLDCIKKFDRLDHQRTVKIRGKEYLIDFVGSKYNFYVLGRKASESFKGSDRFFGTVHVSEKPSPAPSKIEKEFSGPLTMA